MFKRIWILSAAAGLLLTSTLPAYAVKTVGAKTAEMIDPPAVQAFWTDEEYKAKRAWSAKQANRVIAKTDVVNEDTALSEDFRNLRNRLIGGVKYKDGKVSGETFPGVSTPDQLDAFLAYYETSYNSLATDAKFVAAQMIPMRVYRGIIARSLHLLQTAKLAHSTVATILRLTTTGIYTFLPTKQAEAAIQYVAMPFDGMKDDINSEADLQRFMQGDAFRALDASISHIYALNLEKQIYFDNKLAYGKGDFPLSDYDRFTTIGEAERFALLGGLSFAESALASTNAYSLNGFFEAVKRISKQFGYDAAKGYASDQGINGVSAKERTQILRDVAADSAKAGQKTGQPGLFKRNPNGVKWMSTSWVNLRNAIQASRVSYDLLKKNKDSHNDMNLFNPQVFLSFDRIVNASFENLEPLVDNPTEFTENRAKPAPETADSKVVTINSAFDSKEHQDVDLKKFFMHPPADLFAFLPTPTGFKNAPFRQFKTPGHKTTHEWHNYLSESPTAWDLGAFQPYFPGINKQEDVQKAARVLSQAWGGWLVGLPLAAVIF